MCSGVRECKWTGLIQRLKRRCVPRLSVSLYFHGPFFLAPFCPRSSVINHKTRPGGIMTETSNKAQTQPLRFAHPYFTNVPPAQRPVHEAYGQRMTDHIQGKLNPIPPVKGDSLFTLADVIGQAGSDGIAAAGHITHPIT